MKNIRVFYKKCGRMRFVSHLDMNRFMSRIIMRSGIPIWYTEGFNPHPYITFALPLPLGFESDYEIMDIKVEDDNITYNEICDRISDVCPEYISIICAAEPVLKTGKVAFAEFRIRFENASAAKDFYEFLGRESVICRKTTKRGNVKEIDIIPKIIKKEIKDGTVTVILPAGSEDNLNPTLLLDAFFEGTGAKQEYYGVTRTKIFDADMNLFE